jgi:S-adenosylmethionine hydrolase
MTVELFTGGFRPMSPITLTTDFGNASPYVAAMKGVILSVNPAAAIHDLSHAIPPQDLRHASQFLAGGVPYFPQGTVHVCVVDPGVGTDRAILLAEAGGQRLLAPDNGCLTEVLAALGGVPVVRRVAERKFWRATVSSTFHGRDVFAPVAAHLSLGVPPADMGPVVSDWVTLNPPELRKALNQIAGEVMFVDDFGNLITNIPAECIRQKPGGLKIGKDWRTRFSWVRTYSEAAPGTVVALASSDGRLELAVSQGNAAKVLHAAVGTGVTLVFPSEKEAR